MEEGSQGQHRMGWAAVFVKEGQREGGGVFVAGRAEVELTYTDVSQP